MDLETAKKVIESPVVQKYIEQIDADAQAALDQADTNLGGMGSFPSGAVSEYKAHRAALDSAWGDFNAAWNLIVVGKAKDGSAAMNAYQAYVIALIVLEEDNVVIGAFIEAKVAEFAAALIAFMIEVIKAIQKRFADLLKELQDLQQMLQKAKKNVKGAEAQRVINVAITAVSLCIPAVGLGAGIAIAATTFTVQMVVDASLGPGNPSVIGTINTAAGDVVGLPKAIKPPFAKLGGAASGLITLKMDTDEIADAKKIVQQIQAKMKSVQSTIKTLEPWVSNSAVKLDNLHIAFEKALEQAQAKAKSFKSAQAQRLGLLKELEELR
jgi:hypothetical protein